MINQNIFDAIIEKFGLLINASDSDETYILPDGTVLDTTLDGIAQHENIATFVEKEFEVDDMSGDRSSILLDELGSIKISAWVPAIVLPKKNISSDQKETLIKLLNELGKDSALSISSLDGNNTIIIDDINIDKVMKTIDNFYSHGFLTENKGENMKNLMEDFNIADAFRALDDIADDEIDAIDNTKTRFDLLDADDIDDIKGLMELSDASKDDPIELVTDLDASSDDDLKKAYVGKAILACQNDACGGSFYINQEDLVPTEDVDMDGNPLYNADMECPFCHNKCNNGLGFKLIGKVEPLTAQQDEELPITDPTDIPVEAESEPLQNQSELDQPEDINDDTHVVEQPTVEGEDEPLNTGADFEEKLASVKESAISKLKALKELKESKEDLKKDKDEDTEILTEQPCKEGFNDICEEPEVKDEKEECKGGICESLTDINESKVNELVSSYLKEVYQNAESFTMTEGTLDHSNNSLIIEGTITFKSGKTKNTKFVFESIQEVKGKVKFVGLNETFTAYKKAFTMQGSLVEGVLEPLTLTYSYRAKTVNESKRIYGRAKLVENSKKLVNTVKTPIVEKVEEKHVCEKCGKEICECDKQVKEGYEELDVAYPEIKQELLDKILEKFPEAEVILEDIIFDDSRSWSLYVDGDKLGLPVNKFGAYRNYEGGGVRGPLTNNGRDEEGTVELGNFFEEKLKEIETIINEGSEDEFNKPTGVLLDDQPQDDQVEEAVLESKDLEESITAISICSDEGQVDLSTEAGGVEVKAEDGKVKIEVEASADTLGIGDEPVVDVDTAMAEVDAQFDVPEMGSPSNAPIEQVGEMPAMEMDEPVVSDDMAAAEVDDAFPAPEMEQPGEDVQTEPMGMEEPMLAVEEPIEDDEDSVSID